MKIDLHCHTKKIKSGDPDSRDVSPEIFAEKIGLANVKIVAITNHNHFDYEQYKIFSKAVTDTCAIWPGVELDVIDDTDSTNKGHLIVIANPKNIESFVQSIKELIGDIHPDKFHTTLPEVYSNLDKCDVFYIPHFNKKPYLSEECINNFNSLLNDPTRLFKETTNYRSLGIYSNFNYSVIFGSDVRDWSKYEKEEIPDIRLPVSTFEQFCLLAKKDRQIVDTLLKQKRKKDITVSPANNVKFTIPIYNDINIVFGQKGTGKTEILKSLQNYYNKNGTQAEIYIGSERGETFEKLLSCDGLQQDLTKFNIHNDISRCFGTINEWREKLPTSFNSYIDWWKTKDNNKSKKKMKITDSQKFEEQKKDRKQESDYKFAQEFLNSNFYKINFDRYIPKDTQEQLNSLIELLVSEISKVKTENWKTENAIKLSNFTLEKIKTFADKCSDTKSKPISTGFSDFASSRFIIYDAAISILSLLDSPPVKELQLLGTLEEKGDIYIQTQYRFLCKDSTRFEFNNIIKKLQKLKYILEFITKNIASDNLADQISDYQELYDEGFNHLSTFIGISKQIVLENGQPYNPSNGEKGILLMQKMLLSDADVYILDEPELGMGNSYITANILPKLTGLAKQMKTVVVTTHNANIAVSTLPYSSVFRTHANGNYQTYVGNPFSDELINIEDKTDTLNWTAESIHTLEGGYEAFYGRKDIYESGK